MKKRTYQLNPKLDTTLNSVLNEYEKERKDIGYDTKERRLSINVISDLHEIQGLENLTKDSEKPYVHSGQVTVDYLSELAKRDDIQSITSKIIRKLIW